jgi:hypothetical protein
MLWVFDANIRARRFYGAAGFMADGGARSFSRGGANAPELRYRKPL